MSDTIDADLNSQELSLKRDKEIERIINAFTLDPYQILELDHENASTLTSIQIKKQYRAKSLLIHPDKTTNPDAPKAFNTLKKAESNLQDQDFKSHIDEIYDSTASSSTKKDIKHRYESFKDILIQQEFAKRINQQKELQRQGELNRMKEEMMELNELKRKYKKQWEDNQENRVKNWRSYTNKVVKKVKKKDKTKKKVLA